MYQHDHSTLSFGINEQQKSLILALFRQFQYFLEIFWGPVLIIIE